MLLLHCSQFLSLTMFALLVCWSVIGDTESIPKQSSLLLDLKHGFAITSDILVSWRSGFTCCNWEGITCDPISGNIIGLDLSGHNITGGINYDALFGLTSLQSLDLSNNRFDGINIPQSGFEKLKELRRLNLSRAGFAGSLNKDFFQLKRLERLDLSGNNISDVLPDFPKGCALQFLYLSGTSISGSIPDSIGNLQNLTEFKMLGFHFGWRNRGLLTGELPLSIGKLARLAHMDLSFNYIVGEIPFSIGNLTQLAHLDLSKNNITGTIPFSIGKLAQLAHLDLSKNNITGTIPFSIGKLAQLAHLDLSKNNITGTIPFSIGNLAQLAHMNLSFNYIAGEMPFSTGSLTQLAHLDLSVNYIADEIPLSIGNLTQLAHLDLSFNYISGAIPSSIGKLLKLMVLAIPYNNLTGPIPRSVFALPLLQELELFHNQLSGEMDMSLNASTSLKAIYLSHNQFCGQIPSSIFHLPSLEYLFLDLNNFSGAIELDMNVTLRNLSALNLSNNKLSLGELNDIYFHTFPNLNWLGLAGCGLTKVPTFLEKLDAMSHIDLSSNKIGGDIPRWIFSIGKSPNLLSLNLSYNLFTNIEGSNDLSMSGFVLLDLRSNMLQGPIPLPPPHTFSLDFSNNNFSAIIPHGFFLNLKGARYVSIANNTIIREIPPSICEASTLEILDLSGNLLSGSIPSCLLENGSLSVLNLGGNQLNGTIPQNINKGCQLISIILSNNRLEGTLPRSLVNCSRLQVLDLANNHIMDSFPFWLGDHVGLQVLILKANMFHGPLRPSESRENNCFSSDLRILDLSSNHFHGNMSLICFSGRSVLRANNSLPPLHPLNASITYPYTFYENNIEVIKGQEYPLEMILKIFYNVVDFSNNSLEGGIPRVIGELQRLHVLNLSHNSLTGMIPFELGDLTQLESLDLSVNNLSGEIPQHLTSLTFLGTLNLSSNNLVGSIPQGNQFSAHLNSSFQDNPRLCGIPLSKQCSNARQYRPIAMPPAITTDQSSSSSSYVIGLALSVGIGFGVGISVVLVLQNVCIEFWKRLGRCS